ncbi:hypothetical protein [Lysinibacillus fusiformis]|uniref:hypothetical protein n=1 Tax=Lysinibacillus fusiformis TaxID=28031 RepID=UPI002E203D34|nr:hypothetical protein [Lysinibacillus fusiformis]
MNKYTSGDIIFSLFSILGLLFYIIPIAFIIWFAISTTKQLKRQTKLLEEIKESIKQ